MLLLTPSNPVNGLTSAFRYLEAYGEQTESTVVKSHSATSLRLLAES